MKERNNMCLFYKEKVEKLELEKRKKNMDKKKDWL